MLGLKIDIDDFYERIWAFKRNADRFMVSKGGSYMRFGILLSVTTAYPIANILMNGPLLSTLFPMRYKLNNQIPDRLKKMIDQQSYMWLEKEAEATTDAFFTFTLQLDGHYGLDSLRMGSLSRATGARIALPFYVQFNDEDEAMEYAKKFLEPFDILGKKTRIAWDSTSGRRLLSTFVLSDEALAFLVTRDLYAVKQPYLVTREALVWFCHVLTYMFCFYALHAFAFKFDSVVFVIALPLLLSIAIFSAYEWNKFALYANEHHADISAANLSTKHTQGGQEYYSKFLLRNRLLRDLVQDGNKIFTPVGDVKKAIAKYVLRFDGINDVHSENDELILSVAGDDLPEEE